MRNYYTIVPITPIFDTKETRLIRLILEMTLSVKISKRPINVPLVEGI